MDAEPIAGDSLLTPAEVAAILYVDPKTVTRWAKTGKLNCFLTPGGHRRFLKSDIHSLINRPGHGGAVEPFRGYASALTSEDHHRPAMVQHPWGARTTADPSGQDADDAGPVVLRLSCRDAEALATSITPCAASDPGLDSLLSQLSRAMARVSDQRSLPAGSVLAAARDVVEAAANTEQSVIDAALTAATAAARQRHRKAVAASTAAHELAQAAAFSAADIESRADATAQRVANAAVQAAEIIAASPLSGGDVATALTALHQATTVDAAVIGAAEETALAAAAVARVVAMAATQAALAAATAAAAYEQKVASAAAAVQVVATTAARDLAVEKDANAATVALDARHSRRM